MQLEIDRGAGSPLTIAAKAIQEHKRLKKSSDSFEKADEVWAVFDRDTHDNVKLALAKLRQAGVSVAYSNPCFELWLLLHHQDFDRPDAHHSIQEQCAKVIPGYNRTSRKIPDCDWLMQHVSIAETRAERQLERRAQEGAEDEAPSTTVGGLTYAIRTWKDR